MSDLRTAKWHSWSSDVYLQIVAILWFASAPFRNKYNQPVLKEKNCVCVFPVGGSCGKTIHTTATHHLLSLSTQPPSTAATTYYDDWQQWGGGCQWLVVVVGGCLWLQWVAVVGGAGWKIFKFFYHFFFSLTLCSSTGCLKKPFSRRCVIF